MQLMLEVNLKRFLCVALLLPLLSWAGQDDGYVDTGQWQVSLAMGYGQKSNPLVGGDDLPLVLLPEIAYYGERFYFDNGDLGYTFIDSEGYSLSAVSRLNIERAYFSFLHPANILISSSVSEQIDSGDVCIDCYPGSGGDSGTPVELPSVNDLAKRDYAVDAGLQVNVYLSEHSMLRAELMQDVSGVYKGQNALVEYNTQIALAEGSVGLSVGVRFKSRRLVDYYYGLSPADGVDPVFHYQAKATFQPYIKLTAHYPVTERWSVLALARLSKLGSGMTNSPVVNDDTASTLYLGAGYAF